MLTKTMEGDQLDERKLKILKAIISSYNETGEPVGSRLVAKDDSIGLSSATIRNEMQDLEEAGYLIKTHLSSGRVPSQKAYRLYVDMVLQKDFEKLSSSEKKFFLDDIKDKSKNLDSMIGKMSKVLSSLTDFTSLAYIRKSGDTKLKSLELLKVDENKILAIFVYEDFAIDKKLITLNEDINEEELNYFKEILNKNLAGKSINSVDFNTLKYEKNSLLKYRSILDSVLEKFSQKDEKNNANSIFLEGINKILNYPEYSNFDKAKELIELLEDKKGLLNLLESENLDKDLVIKIGNENDIDIFDNIALVLKNVNILDNEVTFGLIAPMRIDYKKVLSIFDDFYMDDLF